MKYGIISDIHANLEALEVAIDALSGEKIEMLLCAGDIVGYGADPGLCIEKIKSLRSIIVCGNHDEACVDLTDIACFNDSAKKAILWTKEKLTEEDKNYLKNLGLVYKNRYLTLVHGTLYEPEMFHYMIDANAAYATFSLMQNRVCFVGHSHTPGIYLYKNDRMSYFYKEKIKIGKDEKIIVNVGSVGQPRDGDPRLCYSTYDTESGVIELKRLEYDVKLAQKKMRDAGLPYFLADRLATGV